MEGMLKEFVPYDRALRMKSLGFDEPCITFYPVDLTLPLVGIYATLGLNGKHSSLKDGYRNSTVNILWTKKYKRNFANVAAPTFSQAFRWFREKYGLHSWVQLHNGYMDDSFYKKLPITWTIMEHESGKQYYERDTDHNYLYHAHEEAELACLDKLLEIVESKSE